MFLRSSKYIFEAKMVFFIITSGGPAGFKTSKVSIHSDIVSGTYDPTTRGPKFKNGPNWPSESGITH